MVGVYLRDRDRAMACQLLDFMQAHALLGERRAKGVPEPMQRTRNPGAPSVCLEPIPQRVLVTLGQAIAS